MLFLFTIKMSFVFKTLQLSYQSRLLNFFIFYFLFLVAVLFLLQSNVLIQLIVVSLFNPVLFFFSFSTFETTISILSSSPVELLKFCRQLFKISEIDFFILTTQAFNFFDVNLLDNLNQFTSLSSSYPLFFFLLFFFFFVIFKFAFI